MTSAAPAFIILTFRHTTTDPYLDAGTGSIMIQALIGGVVGGLFALKIFWNKIKTFFKSLFNRGKTGEVARD
jgi:uncharacterized membrane-anchored protein YitT (DUF2179 family)